MRITEYKPKGYVLPDEDEDIDVDASNAGDYVVCNLHPDEIIYVFGTNFWRNERGESHGGWNSLPVRGYCTQCGLHKTIYLGSYGG